MTDKEIEVIIKPIFTKMFDSNFSACEYGIECYKKGMEYQGIKELAIENDNLIKRIAELKADNDARKFAMTMSEKVEKQLREESAELKEIIDNDVDKKIYVQLAKKAELADVQKGQLIKAKEIITSLLNVFVYDLADDEMDTGDIDTKTKAEQFLKEVEE